MRIGAILAWLTAALSVVVIQALMLRSRGWTVPLGNVAEWVAGVGGIATVGALIVAWLVYRHEVKSRHEDERARIEDFRRQQAENLTAWLGSQTVKRQKVGLHGKPPGVTCTVQVNILNASPSVVYDVVVVTLCRHDERTVTVVNLAEGPATATRTEWEPSRDRLARGRAQVIPPGPWQVSVMLAHPSVIGEHVHLFFRDHRGVYWWRDADGRLTEQSPPPADDDDGKGRTRQIENALGEGPSKRGAGVLFLKRLTDAEPT